MYNSLENCPKTIYIYIYIYSVHERNATFVLTVTYLSSESCHSTQWHSPVAQVWFKLEWCKTLKYIDECLTLADIHKIYVSRGSANRDVIRQGCAMRRYETVRLDRRFNRWPFPRTELLKLYINVYYSNLWNTNYVRAQFMNIKIVMIEWYTVS